MVEICGEILVSLSSHLYYMLVCQFYYYMVYEWYSYPYNSKRYNPYMPYSYVKGLLHQLENTK